MQPLYMLSRLDYFVYKNGVFRLIEDIKGGVICKRIMFCMDGIWYESRLANEEKLFAPHEMVRPCKIGPIFEGK